MRRVGLGVMSHRRLSSLRVSWSVSSRRLRTYGWSWGAEGLRGWIPWGWSASASMASHAACGMHPPPAGWRRQFSTDPLRGWWTRPSREGSVGPTFAAPRAACGCSAATTVPERGPRLGRRSGRGWPWWGRGDWWRSRARGSPRSPVVWGCVGSGVPADVEPRVRAHRLRLGVGLRFAVAAVAGHLLNVG